MEILTLCSKSFNDLLTFDSFYCFVIHSAPGNYSTETCSRCLVRSKYKVRSKYFPRKLVVKACSTSVSKTLNV